MRKTKEESIGHKFATFNGGRCAAIPPNIVMQDARHPKKRGKAAQRNKHQLVLAARTRGED